jgi:hypothetical protein
MRGNYEILRDIKEVLRGNKETLPGIMEAIPCHKAILRDLI